MATLAKKVVPGELAGLEDQMAALDAIADECGLKVVDQKGRFSAALALASGVQKLRAAMTKELVEASLMPLMNTALGFLTDKNPATAKPGQAVTPYTWEVVRDCTIEGVIRGFRPVGNEINIIAGRCYGAKAGFERVVGEYPGVTDLALAAGVPKMVGEGALVPFSVVWKKDGIAQRLNRQDNTAKGGADERIPVRVNAYMGTDAIIGKATRKALALVYGRLCGSKISIPDGEVEDPEFRQAKPTDVKTVEGVKLDGIKPGKPSDYQEHDKLAKPAAKQPTVEELREGIKRVGGGLDPSLADDIIVKAGLVEVTIDECEDVTILSKALADLKTAAGVA